MIRRAVTLVEVLTTIAVIGLLLQILLPGVQSAREAARRMTCTNNLRQQALAAQLHVNAHQFFPSGGWTSVWAGDPSRGFSREQPGGWCYNILPYLDEQQLHDMGLGMSPEESRKMRAKMFGTPVSVFACPARRPAQPWPFDRILFNVDDTHVAGRSDYAANMGNLEPKDHAGPGPRTYEESETWVDGTDPATQWVGTYHNGPIYQRSEVRPAQVRDGLSHTFLFGEKFMSISHYASGESDGDDQGICVGFDRDIMRTTNRLHPPVHDTKYESLYLLYGDDERVVDFNFGSSHPNITNMANCDGSVEPVRFDIDMRIFGAKGSRAGREYDR